MKIVLLASLILMSTHAFAMEKDEARFNRKLSQSKKLKMLRAQLEQKNVNLVKRQMKALKLKNELILQKRTKKTL